MGSPEPSLCWWTFFVGIVVWQSTCTANVHTEGVRTQKCADVNLTRTLWNMLPWKQVVDIEMYNTNQSKFAYCNTGGCSKVNDSRDSVPVFWNRVQVNDGSLLLTGVEENDNGLEIKVTVHLNASPDDTKVKKTVRGMETVRVYTLKILVLNNSQEPKLALPITPPTTRTDRSSLPPSSHADSPKKSSASAANGQEWTVVVMVLAVFLGTIFGS